MKTKSWVWQYAHREGDRAICYLCKPDSRNTFSCRGGTTGSLTRHLQAIHGISGGDGTRAFDSSNGITISDAYSFSDDKSNLFSSLDATMKEDFQVINEASPPDENEPSTSGDHVINGDEGKKMKMRMKSWVWQYAQRGDERALCYLCGESFSYRGGSTASLGRHLQIVHGISGGIENKTPTPADPVTSLDDGKACELEAALTSWVWEYAHREGDNAKCNFCDDDDNNSFSCRDGSLTASLERHFQRVHRISMTDERKSSTPTNYSILDDKGDKSKIRAKSWVWQHGYREGDVAICNLCTANRNNSFSCRGGTTGSLGRHLQAVHGITAFDGNNPSTTNSVISKDDKNTENESSLLQNIQSPVPKKRKLFKRRTRRLPNIWLSSKSRQEEIDHALTKMIVLNQMPLAFSSSKGFLEFMTVVEPNYKPSEEEEIRQRLQSLREDITKVIKKSIDQASGASCTSECWTSAGQKSYITIAAHLIDTNWEPRTFTLQTSEIDEIHTSGNLEEEILKKWGLRQKVMALVTDNNVKAEKSTDPRTLKQCRAKLTCAALTLQSAVQTSISFKCIQSLIERAKNLVGYLKHSDGGKTALEERQKQLGLPVQSLLPSCSARWTWICIMLQWLVKNQKAIMSLLQDHSVTSPTVFTKLEISDWISFEELANALEPVHMLSNLLSAEDSPASMVRPLMHELLVRHMMLSESDSNMVTTFKRNFIRELRQWLNTEGASTLDQISTRQVASLLDPRYKDLEHEDYRTRTVMREKLKQLLAENAPIESSPIGKGASSSTKCSLAKKSALEFLYKAASNRNDVQGQLDAYLSEPQLKFDLSPFDWWRHREHIYPAIAHLARIYLTIPATTFSPERRFSSAEGIGASKKDSLISEDVDLMAFLYQNREMLDRK